MNLEEIASVSGKSGLFKILKPTRTGVVLESLDEAKSKLIINSNTKVSILKDISIYTITNEGNKPLSEILMEMKESYGDTLPIKNTANDVEFKTFFKKVVPEYDNQKVYVSDIRKLVNWYSILNEYAPELFEKAPEKDDKVGVELSDPKAEKVAVEETK